MRANLQYDSPEPALWLCSYLTCRWREREGSTAWGRTDGYCHTLQCRPERCAVKFLQESIDEGQLPVWKPCKRKHLITMQVWLTDSVWLLMLACCMQNTVYIPGNINESVHARIQSGFPIHGQRKSRLSVGNFMRPLPYILLETVVRTTAGCSALV